jgi:hypothetical protein
MSTLHDWAAQWRIPIEALADLQHRFGMEGNNDTALQSDGVAEANVLVAVRREAAQKGFRLWRNNNGATYDANNRFIRFGLANDSEAVNRRIKSADLIGCRPVVITAGMVGHVVGQFVSREVKAVGWHYTGTEREQAQLRWAELVAGLGGDACFATGVGTL